MFWCGGDITTPSCFVRPGEMIMKNVCIERISRAQSLFIRHLSLLPAATSAAAGKEGGDADGHTCSCRKSTCVLLYCPCFGEGRACRDACKCKDCKNPRGANPTSDVTDPDTGRKMTSAKKAELERRAAKKISVEAARRALGKNFPPLLMLTVSPGRLGLTLAIVPEGGAKIMAVDPACTFRGQVEVGDRILTIDGKKVEKLEDATVGRERVRKFGIVKKTKAAASAAGAKSPGGVVPVVPEGPAYGPAAPPPSSRLDDVRRQTFPFLREMKANTTDRGAEHRREDIMTELLQWDKKNNINVSKQWMDSSVYIRVEDCSQAIVTLFIE